MNIVIIYPNTVLFSVSRGVAKASTNLEQHAYREILKIVVQDCVYRDQGGKAFESMP